MLDLVEDERDHKPMGVIRKKTASRGTEAGTKFHCDVCSVDVTSTVSAPTAMNWNNGRGHTDFDSIP